MSSFKRNTRFEEASNLIIIRNVQFEQFTNSTGEYNESDDLAIKRKWHIENLVS